MSNAAAICDQIIAKLHQHAEKVLAVMNEETEKAMDEAYIEFGDYQRMAITEIFTDAVREFYNAYSPSSYSRTNGLYDILELKTNEYGIVEYGSVTDLLEPGNMHTDRSGGDLFAKVFMLGWHGGATGTDKWGVSKSSPHYRTPVGWYTHWGAPAAWSEPPYDIFERNLEEAESGRIFSEFKKISDKHNELAMARVRKLLPSINAEVFG